MKPGVAIYAHRGGSLYPPNLGIENTLRAFENAAALGVEWMETDVHASSDGVVFAAHDTDLARISGRPEPLARLTARALDQVLVHDREPLPRLEDLMAALPRASFNIDMKSDAVVGPLVRLLRRVGHERVRLASFATRRLERVRRALPGVRTSASTGEVARILSAIALPSPLARRWAHSGSLDFDGIDALQVPYRVRGAPYLSPAIVRHVHRMGFDLHVWTVDDEADFTTLIRLGVDAIVTDRPDRLSALLARPA